jgi:ABC-type sulfate transport system permease component
LISSTWLRITIIATVGLYAINAVLIPFYVLISRFLGNQVAINWGDLITASISTISVAALGAFIALVLSAPIGIILSGSSTRVGRTAQRIITIGHGLPGVVVGLAIVSIGSKLGALYQITFSCPIKCERCGIDFRYESMERHQKSCCTYCSTRYWSGNYFGISNGNEGITGNVDASPNWL